MPEKQKIASLYTPIARVAFQYVFEKNTYNDNPKYEITLCGLDPKDLGEMSQAVMECVRKKWGNNVPKNLRSPFRDGSEKEELDGFKAGEIFITFRTNRKPGVVDAKGHFLSDPGEFYSGCWARVTCNPYAYDRRGNKGVAFGLNNVQKIRDDEPFVGGPSVEDEFPPENFQDATAYSGMDAVFGGQQPQTGGKPPIF